MNYIDLEKHCAQPIGLQSLYFAYGSNLSLEQMATRCPESRFIGKAHLHNHRWQINQRGYANIVSEPGSIVEGLCYILSAADEARLDKNEGVPVAYEKSMIEVELFTARAALVGRDVTEIVAFDLIDQPPQQQIWPRQVIRPLPKDPLQGNAVMPFSARSLPPPPKEQISSLEGETRRPLDTLERRNQPETSSQSSKTPPSPTMNHPSSPLQSPPRPTAAQSPWPMSEKTQRVENNSRNQEEPNVMGEPRAEEPPAVHDKHGESVLALVYINHQQTENDQPRREYITRMLRAVRDGMKLGISRHYINTVIMPYLEASSNLNEIPGPL